MFCIPAIYIQSFTCSDSESVCVCVSEGLMWTCLFMVWSNMDLLFSPLHVFIVNQIQLKASLHKTTKLPSNSHHPILTGWNCSRTAYVLASQNANCSVVFKLQMIELSVGTFYLDIHDFLVFLVLEYNSGHFVLARTRLTSKTFYEGYKNELLQKRNWIEPDALKLGLG